MIKVKNTKTHSVSLTFGESTSSSKIFDYLVTDAELVLVSCDVEDAYLWKDNVGKLRFMTDAAFAIEPETTTNDGLLRTMFSYYKPILISRTENIEHGDLIYDNIFGILKYPLDNEGVYARERFYKILALPENFSTQLIKDIIDGKFKHGDNVLVECQAWNQIRALTRPDELYFTTYLNVTNHITVFTIDNVIKKSYMNAFYAGLNSRKMLYGTALEMCKFIDDQFEEWFEKNVKSK